MIANETNHYAYAKCGFGWHPTNADEIWAFLGVVVLMGYHRLPSFSDYWSKSEYVGVRGIQRCMTYSRFSQLWRNLHVADNSSADRSDRYYKIRPLVVRLQDSFRRAYHPAQELSLDESMIKCKGRAKGKVFMPKKPIKRGFKMYSLSCACCGYLCDFRLCAGKEVDPVNGKRLDKPVKVADTVKDLLVSVYSGHNHVVYMDRYFTNGPTVSELQQVGIFTVGTIQRSAAGFPPELKSIDPPEGVYCAALHNGLHYYVFNDRSIVCFVSNVFPLHTEPMLRKAKGSKGGCMTKTDSVPPVVPAYNHYMGGVDRTNHMCQTYLLDHRCMRPWMRIFVQLFQLAVMNASLLHSHNCRAYGVRCKSNLQFRQELVELCLQGYCGRERKRSGTGETPGSTISCFEADHELVRVRDIPIARGRCARCHTHTTFGCKRCKVRLCKLLCFQKHHSGCV